MMCWTVNVQIQGQRVNLGKANQWFQYNNLQVFLGLFLMWIYKQTHVLWAGNAQSVWRLVTGWMVRGLNPCGASRFSSPVQTGPGAHPASCQSFPEAKRPGRGVDHPPHLSPRLKKEYNYPLLLLKAFVASSRIKFTLTLFVMWGTLLVAQLVEALRYKLEGRGCDSRWGH